MAHRVAPVRETLAAAVRAHLEVDDLAGGEVDDGHFAFRLETIGVLRRVVAHPPARLPAHGVVHRLRLGDQLRARAIANLADDAFREGGAAVVGARLEKTRGQEDGGIVIAVLLAENGQLVKLLVNGDALLLLNGDFRRAARRDVADGGFQTGQRPVQCRQRARRQRAEARVTRQPLKDSPPKLERVGGVVLHKCKRCYDRFHICY